MKKYLFFIIMLFCSIITFGQNYMYSNRWCETYALGVGYSHFNENHGDLKTDFKNNQIDIFGVAYGIYMDASFGVKAYSPYDGQDMSTIGMNFGYMIPLNKRNYQGIRLYIGPVIGFQHVGNWRSGEYYDPYYGWEHTSFFEHSSEYFNYGGICALSIRHLWLQGKFTKMQMGFSIGYNF